MFKPLITGAAMAGLIGWALQPAVARMGGDDAFATTMYDNTVAGKDRHGDRVRLTFLPGGVVGYELAHRRSGEGTWAFDSNGHLCLEWTAAKAPRSGCYRINVADNTMTLSEKGETIYRGKRLGGARSTTIDGLPD